MYCTLEEILKRVPEKTLVNITQDERSETEVNEERINSAIADCDALIDSKLAFRYTLPLASVPPRLVRVAFDITIYFLYNIKFDNEIPKRVVSSYKEAIEFLDKIMRG